MATTTRDCPMCGGTMKIKETQVVTHVPGNPSATTRTTSEWVCPDCDYFEEAEEESD
jgi:YgiT-type zinc finger domain-containing protein